VDTPILYFRFIEEVRFNPPDWLRLMNVENLLDGIPRELPEELLTTILRAKGFRVERIVSQGHCSPPGFWYEQEDHEWVIVLEGSAAIQFEGDPGPVQLERGSYLNIPAHVRHRVVRTSATERTVWLAIHYGD
jgi:cupin 2 domain-containing protein